MDEEHRLTTVKRLGSPMLFKMVCSCGRVFPWRDTLPEAARDGGAHVVAQRTE